MKRLFGVCLAMSAVACSQGSFEGDVNGDTLTVNSAIFANATMNDSPVVVIGLTDADDACDLVEDNEVKKNMKMFFMVLMKVGASGLEAATTGDYSIGLPTSVGMWSLATFDKRDASCVSTETSATAGTIKVSSLDAKDGGAAVGDFDLTMGAGGDKVKGDFDASFCGGIKTMLESETEATCVD